MSSINLETTTGANTHVATHCDSNNTVGCAS